MPIPKTDVLKVVKTGRRHCLIIGMPILSELGLQAGDYVRVIRSDTQIILRPMPKEKADRMRQLTEEILAIRSSEETPDAD